MQGKMPFASFVPGPAANAEPSTLTAPRVFREYRNKEAVLNDLDAPPGLMSSPDLGESEEEIVLEDMAGDNEILVGGSREEEENNDEDLEPVEPPVMLEESFPVPPHF